MKSETPQQSDEVRPRPSPSNQSREPRP
jgi:hypothetical protein